MSVDEGKLIEQQNEGAAADAALRTLSGAFDDVKRQLFEAWMASGARDETGREKLWISTTLISRVEDVLRRRVVNGQIAAKELEALRNAGEPKKLLGIPLP